MNMRQQPLNAVNNPFLTNNRNKRNVSKKKTNPMGQSRVIDFLLMIKVRFYHVVLQV